MAFWYLPCSFFCGICFHYTFEPFFFCLHCSLEKRKGIAGVLDNIGYRLPEDKKGKFTMLVIILIPTVGYFFLRLVAAYEKVFGKIDVLERVRGSQSQGWAPQQGKRE